MKPRRTPAVVLAPSIWILHVLNDAYAVRIAEDDVEGAGYVYEWDVQQAGATIPMHVAIPGGQPGIAGPLWTVCCELHACGVLDVQKIERKEIASD
jgi:hypothetical protein